MWAGWMITILATIGLIVVLARGTKLAQSSQVDPANALPADNLDRTPWQGFPRASPFDAVRWRDQVPEVHVQGIWYELLAINDLPAQEIVSFAHSMDGKDWQKRFEEDLVELLWRMIHRPGATVTLKVKELISGDIKILNNVPMTPENRDSIRKARADRVTPPS
jgi:hypothetical protein